MRNSSPRNDVPESSSAGSSSPPESSDQNNRAPMKNTFYGCNLLPSKAVEGVGRAPNIHHEVERDQVEIRDEDPLPRSDSHDHPTLYKVIDEFDLGTEKLPVRDRIAFDNMFCHWPVSIVQNIQAGHRHYVTIRDDTECNHGGRGGNNNCANQPLYFRGLNVYFARCHKTGHYFMNLSDVFLARQIKVGDIILFRWDTQNGCFIMEVVRVGT
ncbi:uncharacterized protein LOC115691967 [Syzygium oleosum]|uniref:uncharacterized protein LOC115691967 n=1 Tax=Syzygium oleosum TaxID=219896 RepID=UPI0011D2A7EC|nr:uncharacterized protein LOC115691967 [Syzygium oleosum]